MKYLSFANHVQSNATPETLLTLIDFSSSMNSHDWKPSRKIGAIRANKELIKRKRESHPHDTVGIIGFSSRAKLLHPPVCLRQDYEGLLASLRKNVRSSSTNFTAALELAESCFGDRQNGNSLSRALAKVFLEQEAIPAVTARTVVTKRIILLTDGGHTHFSSPHKIASRLKDAGVIIDCVGIGGRPKDVDEKTLKRIASTNPDGSPRYCFIGDQEELLRKYQTLATHIRVM